MRIVRLFVLAAMLVVVAALLGALVPRPLFAPAEQDGATRTILVVANPIHTDIVLALDADVAARFSGLASAGLPIADPDARWIAFGWGSRAFYIETPTWSELKPVPLLEAVTLDASVMHVTLAGAMDLAHPAVSAFRISEDAHARLVDFILSSFRTGADGEMLPIAGAAYGPDDAFFEAKGSFNALAGCNTWTARALRVAGLQTGWWNPLPQSLGLSLSLHN